MMVQASAETYLLFASRVDEDLGSWALPGGRPPLLIFHFHHLCRLSFWRWPFWWVWLLRRVSSSTWAWRPSFWLWRHAWHGLEWWPWWDHPWRDHLGGGFQLPAPPGLSLQASVATPVLPMPPLCRRAKATEEHGTGLRAQETPEHLNTWTPKNFWKDWTCGSS